MIAFNVEFTFNNAKFAIYTNDTFYSIFVGGVHLTVDHDEMSIRKDINYDYWYLSTKGFEMNISKSIYEWLKDDMLTNNIDLIKHAGSL